MAAKPGPLRPHEQRRSLARRPPQEPPPGCPNLGDSFLIVTEGAVTEKHYFESVRAALQLSPVNVQVVHPRCTDALGLVRAAMSLYETDAQGRHISKAALGNRDVRVIDHVWVLFDTDVPERQGQLAAAMDLAEKENIHIGHSTPSVEVWLLLHFRDRPGLVLDGDTLTRMVGGAWGSPYDKRADTFQKLWPALKPNIPLAVNRSEQTRSYHSKAVTPFPPNPSTELDLLVRALDASVRPDLSILQTDSPTGR